MPTVELEGADVLLAVAAALALAFELVIAASLALLAALADAAVPAAAPVVAPLEAVLPVVALPAVAAAPLLLAAGTPETLRVAVASSAEILTDLPLSQVTSTTVIDSTTVVPVAAGAVFETAGVASAGFKPAAVVEAVEEAAVPELPAAVLAAAGVENTEPSAWKRSSRKVPSSLRRLPIDELVLPLEDPVVVELAELELAELEPDEPELAELGAAEFAEVEPFAGVPVAGLDVPVDAPVVPEPSPICSRAWNTALMKLTRPPLLLPPPESPPALPSLPWPQPAALAFPVDVDAEVPLFAPAVAVF